MKNRTNSPDPRAALRVTLLDRLAVPLSAPVPTVTGILAAVGVPTGIRQARAAQRARRAAVRAGVTR